MSKRLIIGIFILGLLGTLFLVGCVEKNIESSNEEPSLLKPPVISASFLHQHTDYSYQVPLNSPVVFFQGEYFRLTLKFDEALSQNAYTSYIKALEGNEINVTASHDFKSFELVFSNIKAGDTLSFTLDGDIEDIRGLKLKDDINLSFLIAEPIEAAYTILGQAYNLTYPTGNLSPSYGEEDKLTNAFQRIKVDFSKEVNAADVEAVLRNRVFKNDDSFSFQWEGLKTLYVSIDKLSSELYGIELFSYETPIINSIYFTADEPNILYSYSFDDKSLREERIFDNFNYYFNVNPFIKEYLLMVDTASSYMYNLKEDAVISSSDEGLPNYWGLQPWNQEVLWLDSETIIFIDNYKVSTYNLITRKKEYLFSIEEKDEGYRVFEYVLSPDKQKLAIAVGTTDNDYMQHVAYVSVYSLKGERLYGDMTVENIRGIWLAGYVYYLNMGWLNNSELIYEVSTGEEDHGIAVTNINNNTTSIVLEDGIESITAANSGVYAAKQNESYIIKAKGKTLSIPAEGISDIIVKDETTVLYTREVEGITEFVSFDIPSESETSLEAIPGVRFRILGYSYDTESIYLISNQRYLMPIT